MEKSLKENEKLLESYFNSMQDGLSILNTDLDIIRVNPWMEEMYASEKPLVGKKCYNVYQKRNSICTWCPSLKTIESGEKQSEIVPYPFAEEQEGWIELSTFPIKDEYGEVLYIIEYVKDITERMEALENLKASRQQYQEAYKRAEFYKDLFAHDIQNILQGILTANELNELVVNQSENAETIKENINMIKEQVQRGSLLVSNVRKFSQFEEEEFVLEKIDSYRILKKSVDSIRDLKPNRKKEIGIYSYNDKEMDVFNNILINAIKHNDNPILKIDINISKEEREQIDYVRFEFKDNGIGVENNRKDEIFSRGYSEDRSIHGMGLGLSLVRTIIERYNGKIWVEDRIKGDHSRGSNFILLLLEETQNYY
jgi:PAS domain S-box-containing protein